MISNLTKVFILFAMSLSLHSSESDTSIKNKGVLELKNADTVLSVGGRIRLNTIYGWPQGEHSAKKIPLESESIGEQGQLEMDAKSSRLWIKTRTPSEYGMVRTLIESDFLGVAGTETNTNSHGLRLRHAYVQVGNWTVGQTNSAFNAYVTLDILLTAINDTFVRQPLIRYGHKSQLFDYDISFEQPESTLMDANAEIIAPQDDVIPDVIARVRYYPQWGEMSLALMGRYITQNHATLSDTTVLNSRDSAYGWGSNLSAKIKVLELDDIRFGAHYGVGIGRYLAYDAFPAGTITTEGKITLQPSFGGHVGYRHWWSRELRSTISASYAGTDNSVKGIINLDKVNKDVYSTELNLLWTPIANSLIGVEYAQAKRRVESEKEGVLKMFILLLRYDF